MSSFEFNDRSQNNCAEASLSIADLGNLTSLQSTKHESLDSGSFKHAAGDVRPIPGGPLLPHIVIKQGSISNYDGDPTHESATQKKAAAEAVKDLGKEMWHGWTPGGHPGGGADASEGCAASVSQILNDCGATSLWRSEDDNCDYMQVDLLAQGWKLTNTPQPGDVWIGRGGESEAHTGIIGENYKLMDNHSNNGKFSTDSADYTKSWTNNVFLKPPDQKDHN